MEGPQRLCGGAGAGENHPISQQRVIHRVLKQREPRFFLRPGGGPGPGDKAGMGPAGRPSPGPERRGGGQRPRSVFSCRTPSWRKASLTWICPQSPNLLNQANSFLKCLWKTLRLQGSCSAHACEDGWAHCPHPPPPCWSRRAWPRVRFTPSGSPGSRKRAHRDGVRSPSTSWAPESNACISRRLLPVLSSTGWTRPRPGLDISLATQPREQLPARAQPRS